MVFNYDSILQKFSFFRHQNSTTNDSLGCVLPWQHKLSEVMKLGIYLVMFVVTIDIEVTSISMVVTDTCVDTCCNGSSGVVIPWYRVG